MCMYFLACALDDQQVEDIVNGTLLSNDMRLQELLGIDPAFLGTMAGLHACSLGAACSTVLRCAACNMPICVPR